MPYSAEKGKGQPCLELENEGFEVIFGGYCNKSRHISENTRCIAVKFSGYIAKTVEKLTMNITSFKPLIQKFWNILEDVLKMNLGVYIWNRRMWNFARWKMSVTYTH